MGTPAHRLRREGPALCPLAPEPSARPAAHAHQPPPRCDLSKGSVGKLLFQARGAFPVPAGVGLCPPPTSPSPARQGQASQKRRQGKGGGHTSLRPGSPLPPSASSEPLSPQGQGQGDQTPSCLGGPPIQGSQPGVGQAGEREPTLPGALEGFQEEAVCDRGRRQPGAIEREGVKIAHVDSF